MWQCLRAEKHDARLSAVQMTSTEEDLLSLDHYVRKTFHKTASLMANSCKAIAILEGRTGRLRSWRGSTGVMWAWLSR